MIAGGGLRLALFLFFRLRFRRQHAAKHVVRYWAETLDNPFDSARILIERAKEHIAAFEAAAEAFTRNDNWTARVERDGITGYQFGRARFRTDMSPALVLGAYDIFKALRDALDHTLFASALAVNGAKPRRAKFPFGDDAVSFEHEVTLRDCCKDVHADVVKIVLASKAYEAGNRTLWAMNKVRNENTHELITPASVGSPGYGILNGAFIDAKVRALSQWSSSRRELTYVEVRGLTQGQLDIRPTAVSITINPGLGFVGRKAIDVFKESAAEVERIFAAIERETTRILSERAA